MAYPPGAMRQPPTRPPSRPPSLEVPAPPMAEPVPPPPENTWPCGCAYPGAHHTDCMWSLWEQMRANYLQTKTLMSQFMTQVDGLQTGDKARVSCECPPSCHGRDLGQAMGLQQMQGVTVPWLQPVTNTAPLAEAGLPVPAADSYNYSSESRKLVEEQQRVKKTWAQFLNIFDIALDMANDVSKDRWEAARRRKERERLERQERREEERRQRQDRREKCAEERSKSKDEEADEDQQDSGVKEKAVDRPDKEKEKKRESKHSDAKPPPEPPKRRSTQESKRESTKPPSQVEEEKAGAEEEPEESPAAVEEEAAAEGEATAE